MAASTVQIGNRALQKLGAKRISSLTQDHPNARSINAAYERVLGMELRRYAWSFAIRRASVASDATDALWGDWKRYGLPNDFIRLLRDDESGAHVDWKIEAGNVASGEGIYILSHDASPLEFRYIARITNPVLYDDLFMEAFAGRLAMECFTEIKDGGVSDKESIKDDYDRDIAEAKRIGAIEKEAQDFPEDSWIAARR